MRGVTPSPDYREIEARPPSERPDDYGKYGAESTAQRLKSITERPPGVLFCGKCQLTYGTRSHIGRPWPCV